MNLPPYFGAKFEICLCFQAPYREPRLPPPDFIPEEHGVGVPLPPEETEGGGEVNFQENFGGGVGYVRFPAKRRAPGCVSAAGIARQDRDRL